MKTLKDYLVESETWMHTPAAGDDFGIELADGSLVESYILEAEDGSVLLDANEEILSLLESFDMLTDHQTDDAVILETMGYGTLDGEEEFDESWKSKLAGAALAGAAMFGGAGAHAGGVSIGTGGQPDPTGFTAQQQQTMNQTMSQQQAPRGANMNPEYLQKAAQGGTGRFMISQDDAKAALAWLDQHPDYKPPAPIKQYPTEPSNGQSLNQYYHNNPGVREAEYHGREVPLGKPMKGDVKKSKVYVRDPSTGNIKKVNFGDPNMRIKKTSPAHRKSFRARHHCENPGSRLKARYWSCRAW